MTTKAIKTTIKGISPLLMHAFPLVAIEALEKKPAEVQAEHAAYRMPISNGDVGTRAAGFTQPNLYIPGICVQRALIAAATYSKGKGRASLQKPAAACLLIAPEYLDLGVTTYTIDSRPVVVPATKGRIIRHRPRLDEWQVTFDLEYDDTLLKATEVRAIVDNAGSRVGLLDFRPEKKGPFGRFMIIEWTE